MSLVVKGTVVRINEHTIKKPSPFSKGFSKKYNNKVT
jgi:hypothetical protein